MGVPRGTPPLPGWRFGHIAAFHTCFYACFANRPARGPAERGGGRGKPPHPMLVPVLTRTTKGRRILEVPRGGQKCTKMETMPSKNRSKKRRQKRRRCHPLLVECGGLRAARRNARFLLRKVFAMILEWDFKGASTPAGVRRIFLPDGVFCRPLESLELGIRGLILQSLILKESLNS